MKRVIRASLVESGKIGNAVQSVLKAFERYLNNYDKDMLNSPPKFIKENEDGSVVYELDCKNGRRVRVNNRFNADGTFTSIYKTDDGKKQSRVDNNVSQDTALKTWQDAISEFYNI